MWHASIKWNWYVTRQTRSTRCSLMYITRLLSFHASITVGSPRVKGNYDCRISPSNHRWERERIVVCKERLNIFVRFFSLSSIHLWRIRWDLGGKVKGKYTHVCFLFFNCTNRAVVMEGKIKSRREVWIIKVVEKSAAVYERCRRWTGNICYHRVKGEFLRKKI